MKLTTYHKKAIVRSIMADLPDMKMDERNKRAQKLVAAAMSPEVKRLYNKHPTAVATQWVTSSLFAITTNNLRAGNLTQSEVEKALAPMKAEADAYRALKERVEAAVAACSTRKAFIDRYPEFSKYAPGELGGFTPNLPAVANLVADLVKAGWKQTIIKGAKK